MKLHFKIPKCVTDHFADHSMILKHQGFPGQFRHLIEPHGERINKEQN